MTCYIASSMPEKGQRTTARIRGPLQTKYHGNTREEVYSGCRTLRWYGFIFGRNPDLENISPAPKYRTADLKGAGNCPVGGAHSRPLEDEDCGNARRAEDTAVDTVAVERRTVRCRKRWLAARRIVHPRIICGILRATSANDTLFPRMLHRWRRHAPLSLPLTQIPIQPPPLDAITLAVAPMCIVRMGFTLCGHTCAFVPGAAAAWYLYGGAGVGWAPFGGEPCVDLRLSRRATERRPRGRAEEVPKPETAVQWAGQAEHSFECKEKFFKQERFIGSKSRASRGSGGSTQKASGRVH
ncbi:hypothetical protein C8J57DRAFT_1263894 [Mycena rebaudengoi]|nr:hypothetical protein C8J57DRAFT_1263894 [Mycena rebaudengoi]